MIETVDLIYKKTGCTELMLRLYYPDENDLSKKKPAIVFYFGGGWKTGTISHFELQSRYLASKGYIAVTPEYRTGSEHGTTPFECVADAKDALCYLWKKSGELGINPDRIAVSGGSAGGHLAACTAILTDTEFDGMYICKIPKAMVLFNPVCDTSVKGYGSEYIGDRHLEISPAHHVRKGLPPALIFHGTSDSIVPYDSAAGFCGKMKEAGNECEMVSYPGRDHGFFNKGISESDYYDTLYRMEKFLNKKL